MRYTLLKLGAAAMVALTVAACGGSDGAQGPAGPAGPPGATGPTGPTGPAAGATVDASKLTPAEFASLDMTATVTSVVAPTDSAPMVVNFKLATTRGTPVVGFGSTSKSSTATVASYPNLAFSIAKLVPGDSANPSRWVNYMVTTVPTTTAAAAPTRPSTDSTGTLVDNKDGSYRYTFFRNITQIKAQVDAMSVSPPNVKADLGDLTYNGNLTHRLTIQIAGNAPGTGTNTPNAVQTTPGVPLQNPINVIYDFVPATGATAPSGRQMVDNANCDTCHQVLGGLPGISAEADSAAFHGGSRNNINYCVICHTDQRKYGRTNATFNVTATNRTFTSQTYRLYDVGIGNALSFLHKVHLGEVLAMQNYDYAGVGFNETRYPQDPRNCDKCHDRANAATPQASNWLNKPSKEACGACHDGINFTTALGVTTADALAGKGTTALWGPNNLWAHPAGPQPDNTACGSSGCHTASSIDMVHRPVTPPNPQNSLRVADGNSNTNSAWLASNKNRLPEGAIAVSYEIRSGSVRRLDNGNVQMAFRIKLNGTVTPMQSFAAATPNPVTGQKEILANFMGSPSIYFVYAVAQDGITKPAEFNGTAQAYLRTLWYCNNGGGVPGGTVCPGTLSAPDADGYYTVTLTKTGTGSTAVDLNVPSPTSTTNPSSMLTGGVGYSYNIRTTLPLTQTNLAAYPATASTLGTPPLTAGMPNAYGGLTVIQENVQVVATGYTGRPDRVSDAKCNACHQELGAFVEDSFHGGQRNDARTCAWCHTPNRTSSGWTADSTGFVHSIHAAAKLNPTPNPFNVNGFYTWHAISATQGYWQVTYPGILNNCEGCHIAGMYDFSAAASMSVMNNRLFRTAAAGTLSSTTTFSFSPWVTAGTNYGAAPTFSSATQSVTAGAATTLVTSPTTTVCLSCHVTPDAQSHMRINGGSVYAARGSGVTPNAAVVESCDVCHGPGRSAAIADVHAK